MIPKEAEVHVHPRLGSARPADNRSAAGRSCRSEQERDVQQDVAEEDCPEDNAAEEAVAAWRGTIALPRDKNMHNSERTV